MNERTAKEKEFLDFTNVKLSEEDPVKDYINILKKKTDYHDIVSNDNLKECFDKISAIVQAYVWRKLFTDENPTKENLKVVSNLLYEYKRDAAFYNPWDYNQWIVKVRDQLLKRNMIDFWLNEIVKKELGPCWARDSDLFDDLDDPEPAEFYNFADAKAPWLQKQSSQTAVEIDAAVAALQSQTTTKNALQYKKISLETPVEDYRYNMSIQDEMDPDNNDGRVKILKEGQQVVWKLLFRDATLTKDNYMKAATLLKDIKEDSCLYSPHIYNDWILLVRDELINHKYYDFWQNVIVKQKMGLCCYSDSEYFSDADDEKPLEFYKSFEKIMLEKHK